MRPSKLLALSDGIEGVIFLRKTTLENCGFDELILDGRISHLLPLSFWA
jgi:hypothetical protein